MAGKGVVSIDIKIIEGKDGLKTLTLDADGLRKIMESNIEVAQRFEKKVIEFAALTTSINAISKAFGQLSSTLELITGESESFDKAMREANTMAGKDSAGFKQLKGEVADLAKEIPIARDQLANGLYQTISSGVPEDNWIEFLNTSARSAVGGLADINKVVGVTATLVKNYGLEWSAAAEIQDKIQLTAKNGVTSFAQLAEALPRVTGNAATLGVSIDELMGTFATLTGVSGNTAEVSTQLAAIFTALVKPSSEAAEMAARMGIQFDAAAIKAAGGFQNFLTQLNSSIKAYAQTNGVLEQEVYSKLFGSAEAIRALIPLQGEMADKFTSNVASMVNCAGTMDDAYADMRSHGDAVNQMLRNQWAALMDVVAGATSAAKPYVNFIAGLLDTGASAAILITTFKQLNIQQMLVATRSKLASAAIALVGATSKKTKLGLEMLSISGGKAAASAAALKIALRGLLIASGVGVAIAAVTAVIEHFTAATDRADDSTRKLDDATDEYVRAAADVKVQIERDVKELENLIKAKKDTKEAVHRLNESYGDLFGTYQTAAEWYKILTEKSQAYIKQIGYEAQARALASRMAEAAIKKEQAAERKEALEKSGNHKVLRHPTPDDSDYGKDRWNLNFTERGEAARWYDTEEYAQAKKDLAEAEKEEEELKKRRATIAKLSDEALAEIKNGLPATTSQVNINEKSWRQCQDAIEANNKALEHTTDPKKISELKAQNKLLEARQKALNVKPDKGGKKKALVADPKTKDDYQNNVNILSDRLTGEDTPEQKQLIKTIALYKEKIATIELAQAAAERPTELNTLEDCNKELAYLNRLRLKASAENIAAIDKEIARVEDLKAGIEHANHTPIPTDKLQTYAQINSEEEYYIWLMQHGTEQERIFAQQNLNDLAKIRKAWDDVLAELKKPGDISTLDSIEKVEEALSYYQQKQKQSTGDEIQNNQLVIDALNRKLKALQRGIELPSMQREVAEIKQLTGREYKIKIKGMGFDELTSKINELNRVLNDTENPVTDSQRKDIESLKATYEQWRKEGVVAFDTFRSGWNGIKGIGGGVESLTGALKGNGNAWQTVTGIVDGFLQLYEGINTIVEIVHMLGVATGFLTTEKTAEAGATVAAAGAQGTEAAAAEAAALAQVPVIAANKLATASYMELAAAAFFAAHAPLPLIGFGVASGFISAAVSMVEGIGVMPFADGGIVSGPTIGLIGEYTGASNNPEVVAPLDKLRNILADTSTPFAGQVEFKIKGRTLVGVLTKENRIISRT